MTDHFHLFAEAVNKRFLAMSQVSPDLYTVDAGDLFETYLAAFPAGTNPLYRERTEHDCSCCKNFIRNIGHVVAIQDGALQTVWSDAAVTVPFPYNVVAAHMNDVVRQLPINGIYRTAERRYGAQQSVEMSDGEPRRWNHFWCDVPEKNRPAKPDKERGDTNTAAQVFKRALDEMAIGSAETVLDLINAGSLYKGAEKRGTVEAFLSMKRAYDAAPDKNLFIWSNVNSGVTHFRTDVIGTLVDDLSKGVALDDAVRMFESKVAPTNYKRTTALITPKMIDQAVQTIASLGLESALDRRMARLSDVSVNNVLFVDNAVRGVMRDGNLTDMLMSAVKPKTPDLKHATPIGIDDFVRDVIPAAVGHGIELLVQNKHAANFVTITAPTHADDAAAKLFRWDNGFAWSYDGDVADSIKQRVKRAGGNVDNAALRVSLSWSNTDDLDLHCVTPTRQHVFFGNKAGILDVDMNNGWDALTRDAVENMSWTPNNLRNGVYRFSVNQYNKRESVDVGFTIEIDCAGELHQFTYDKAVRGDVPCFDLHMQDGQIVGMTTQTDIKAGNASRDVWSVKTESLVPVDTIMTSPNHWDGRAVGAKHWFFILKGCKNPAATRGIYNEFLNPALEPHRKVFEVLGSKTKCQPTDDQLSGVGFTAARGDSVTAVVKGRAYQVQF